MCQCHLYLSLVSRSRLRFPKTAQQVLKESNHKDLNEDMALKVLKYLLRAQVFGKVKRSQSLSLTALFSNEELLLRE